MLSPETWNFKPPIHQHCVISGLSSDKEVLTEIASHYFNHCVIAVLPDTVLVPEDLNTELTKDGIYYKLHQVSVSKFLDKQFIDHFITKGQLSALSVDTHIDKDDCAALTPSGYLILNLLKETYQSLGLEGVQSKFSTERYVVQIDLKNSSFIPGKKNYERTKKCLSDFVDLQMDFLMSWEPPEPKEGEGPICPSSVAAYFTSCGYKVTSCTSHSSSSRRYKVPLPLVPSDTDYSELLEWLGAIALGVDLSGADSESRYLSRYTGPLDATEESQVAVLTFSGFFTTAQIERFYHILSSYVQKRKDLPWVALHVGGFADSPVSLALQEHTFYTDGDNNYTLVLQPSCKAVIVRSDTFMTKIKCKIKV